MEGQAFVDDFTVYIHEEGQTYSYIINNQQQIKAAVFQRMLTG